MNSVKYVVSLMVIACGMGVLTPWSTCDASGSTVTKIGSGGAHVKSTAELIEPNPNTEKSS